MVSSGWWFQIFTLGNGCLKGFQVGRWWWFQIISFVRTPKIGEMGWNHQVENVGGAMNGARMMYFPFLNEEVFWTPVTACFLKNDDCKTTLLGTNISQPRPALFSRWIFLFLLGGIWTCSLEGTFKGELPSFGGSPFRGIGFAFWGRDESELSLKRYINTVRPWFFRWYTGVYTTQLYEVD